MVNSTISNLMQQLRRRRRRFGTRDQGRFGQRGDQEAKTVRWIARAFFSLLRSLYSDQGSVGTLMDRRLARLFSGPTISTTGWLRVRGAILNRVSEDPPLRSHTDMPWWRYRLGSLRGGVQYEGSDEGCGY